MISTLSLSRFTSWAQTNSWRVPLNFSPTRFSWTYPMAYSKAKLKRTDNKTSPCFRPIWIGKF
jgi:hypothetical protein